MLFSTAISLLHAAKKAGIGIILHEDQLRIKIPKGTGVEAGFLEAIKTNKAQIVDLLREERWKSTKLDGSSRIAVMAADARMGRLPLSFSQERLWFIDQLEGSTAYHVPSILRFKGELDAKALEHAFRSVVNRHEVLRTVIGQQDGVPYQQVMDKDLWSLSVIEDPVYREDGQALRRLVGELVNRPFDLSTESQLRAHLIRLTAQEHVLVATMHHIASDGWSGSILVGEFGAFYGAYKAGRPAALSPLGVQYGDYALWQREQLSGEGFAKKVGYWKRQLEGFSRLELPADYRCALGGDLTGGRVSRVLGQELRAGLTELSHREGATLYMTLLSVFKLLLYRYTGQEDICIGSSIAGRQQAELEGLIGFFANTLALRSRVSG
ncbi:condensation domain-containing protein, partial [Flavitalea flava]